MNTTDPVTASVPPADLPGSAALQRYRGEAVRLLARTPVPDPGSEDWRYSPIGDVDPDAHRPAYRRPPGTVETGDGLVAAVPHAARVRLVDGFVTSVEITDTARAAGLTVRVADSDADVALLDGVIGDDRDHFTVRNAAFVPEPVVVEVPAGVTLDAPIVVESGATPGDEARLVAPRLVVRLGVDADAAVCEQHTSDPGSPLLVASVTEIELAAAARCRHLWIDLVGERTTLITTVAARVARDATFVGGGVGLGGDYARLRNVTRLVGRGATGDLRGVYLARGTQVVDYRSFHHHLAPDTNADLLVKGAVDDKARSIYTGLIHIGPEGRNADAHQTNRVIELSDDAVADSVPNLEIENNEVRCSHASAVGPIDPDERFYLESRAVPPDVAERLVVGGFFAEVVAALPLPEIREPLVELISTALGDRLDGPGPVAGDHEEVE